MLKYTSETIPLGDLLAWERAYNELPGENRTQDTGDKARAVIEVGLLDEAGEQLVRGATVEELKARDVARIGAAVSTMWSGIVSHLDDPGGDEDSGLEIVYTADTLTHGVLERWTNRYQKALTGDGNEGGLVRSLAAAVESAIEVGWVRVKDSPFDIAARPALPTLRVGRKIDKIYREVTFVDPNS